MERVFNNKDDPLGSLNNTKKDYVYILGVDCGFSKERFVNQVNPNIALDEYINFETHYAWNINQPRNSCRSRWG